MKETYSQGKQEDSDAPDLLEVRTSQRGRVPKREWPEVRLQNHFYLELNSKPNSDLHQVRYS